nr:aminoglycoside N3-acetyltransferase [Kibdelosporangium sp. MJ126-NF4]CTQ96116.1 aminoglycoside N3-acetyltransferase [Kibdelosporangium sp. MJ126-NF4]
MHLVEDLAGVPYRGEHWAMVSDGGGARKVTISEPDHCCQGFAAADGWLRDVGAQREGLVGDAQARLFAAGDLVKLGVPRLSAEPTVLLCRQGTGCEECDAAHASVMATG